MTPNTPEPVASDDARALVLGAEELSSEEVAALLAPYGFSDPAAVDRELQALAEAHPTRERFAEVLPSLLQAASRSPDPDRALRHFRDYANARPDPYSLFSMLAAIPDLLDELMFLFGASEYLSSILIRNPHYFDWLLESGARDAEKTREQIDEELREWLRIFESREARLGILRRFKRRETLRIGMRDLLGIATVEQTTREMAILADATFQAAVELVRAELDDRHGTPQNQDGTPATFAVIGMGKLGGEELNFSSDVDIICVYSDDGHTTEGIENQTYFNRLTEQLVRAMSEPTHEGYVFRVDLRLRPQGKAGALARSLDSYEGYYETWGELFDRQALLKARFVAGDRALGESFVKMIQPFVYRSALDRDDVRDVLEEIRRTKANIEEHIARDGDPALHVKLGPGGIRDVEFAVQALQLTHGGHDRSLRVRGTLEAIDALEAAGHFTPDVAARLKSSYCYMRRVENFLQLVADQQRYALPEDADEWELHARRLGYGRGDRRVAGEVFREEIRAHQRFIREVFDRVFDSDADPFREQIHRLLDEDAPSDQTRAFLASYGLTDGTTAHRLLRELARGSRRVRFTPRLRRTFREFAKPLLEQLRETPDPMLALLQFERFLSASGARAQIYPILRERPGILQLLVRILGTSRFLGDILARDPLSFETLTYGSTIQERVESVEAFLDRLKAHLDASEGDEIENIQRFRYAEILRIGTRDILGESDLLATTRELSLLAEAVLQYYSGRLFQELCGQYGTPIDKDGAPTTFAIIGMGKLAGRELNYSSDLDVQFVYSDEGETTQGTPNVEFFNRFVRTIISTMKRPTLGGSLYELDLRLRPYGRGGPMALTVSAYAKYYAQHGELWERQAALKSRPVAGDVELGRRFLETAHGFAYRAPLTAEEAAEIRHVRRRKEDKAARDTSRLRDLKSGYGGLVDIEFLVQALQLHYGSENPALRTQNTPEAIQALAAHGVLTGEEATMLRENYRFLRFVEDRLHIVENRPMSALPTDSEALDKLARRLGYSDANGGRPSEALLREYERRTAQVRRLFDSAFERMEIRK